MKFQLTGSIVIYKNERKTLKEAIKSFLNTQLNVRLYLIDNSPDDSLKDMCDDKRCVYIFSNSNLGFGKAHNIALRKSIEEARYHLVLNPDVYFLPGTLEKIYSYMEEHADVGQVMPKVLHPDGETQHLCKLLPTPADLILRRFFTGIPAMERRNKIYELHESGYDKIMNIPYLSGCFMYLRTETLKEIGLFDERIFMYIEDADLTRRIHREYKTLFYPDAQIYHHYAKGSYRNFRLMLYNVHGAFIYFTKWGWFFDRERKAINKQVRETYLNHR